MSKEKRSTNKQSRHRSEKKQKKISNETHKNLTHAFTPKARSEVSLNDIFDVSRQPRMQYAFGELSPDDTRPQKYWGDFFTHNFETTPGNLTQISKKKLKHNLEKSQNETLLSEPLQAMSSDQKEVLKKALGKSEKDMDQDNKEKPKPAKRKASNDQDQERDKENSRKKNRQSKPKKTNKETDHQKITLSSLLTAGEEFKTAKAAIDHLCPNNRNAYEYWRVFLNEKLEIPLREIPQYCIESVIKKLQISGEDPELVDQSLQEMSSENLEILRKQLSDENSIFIPVPGIITQNNWPTFFYTPIKNALERRSNVPQESKNKGFSMGSDNNED